MRSWFFPAVVAIGVANAATPICAVKTTAAAPALAETITCDQSAISRFFLLSPRLSSLSAQQRTAVLANPVRYAFAYMAADAVARLKTSFADPPVKSVDLTETLVGRNAKGKPVPHEMFQVQATRQGTAHVNWTTLEPQNLFEIVPSALSPWLTAQLKAPMTPPP